MARSFRFILRDRHWQSHHNINIPGVISEASAVDITVGEWIPSGGIAGPTVGEFKLGGNPMWVTNISPHDDEGGGGGVEFMLHINSETPLTVALTVTVHDPVESVTAI